MKAPKCRTCGERHRLGSCPDSEGRTDKAKAREPVDDTAGDENPTPPPLEASRGGKRVVQPLTSSINEAPPPPSLAIPFAMVSAAMPAVKQAITNAQKQKAYRERHKDRVREADRERKREKRDG